MNMNEIETYQATSVELLLNKKVEMFFQNPKIEVMILQASVDKNSPSWKQIRSIEQLIIMIRENIAVGQLKRALKLIIVLETFMKKWV